MTIYDIAKIAGVSASTVSRVANNKPGIKEETRQQIQSLLDQYDYRPNETARGLVNQSSRMIGILITDIRYEHHVDIAYHIEKEMERHGYCSLILNTGLSDEKKAQAITVLSQRRVDGAILVGSTFQCDAVKQALASRMEGKPVVITNGYLDLPNVKGVLVNEKEGLIKLAPVYDCGSCLYPQLDEKKWPMCFPIRKKSTNVSMYFLTRR